MKKVVVFLSLMLVGLFSIAQVTPNDLIIHGTVTSALSGSPIANWPVGIFGGGISTSVTTDTSGYYSYVIIDGSVTGPNQLYYVELLNCDSTYLIDSVSNNQGTIDDATVNFQLCDVPAASCQAMYIANIDPTVASHVLFQNLSTSTDSIISYIWSFNGVQVSTQQYFDFIFPQNQGGEICLSITSSSGCTSQYCTFVTPGNNGTCLPFFSSQAATNNSLSYTFTNATFTSAGNTTYYWYFGDGANSSEANPTHIYNQPGTYSVCLQVMTADCQNTMCQMITVVEGAGSCQALFSYTSLSNPNQVVFNNQSNGAALSFYWTINGGGIFSTDFNPVYTFPGAGVYDVCLHVVSGTMDPIGCEDTFCQQITIPGDTTTSSCASSFSYICSALNPTVVAFTNTSSTTDTTQVAYSWSFGDGSVSSQETPTHTYDTTGTYDVCLTISSSTCTDTFCMYVYAGLVDSATVCNAFFQSSYIGDVPSPSIYPYQFYSVYSDSNMTVGHEWVISNGENSFEANPVFGFVPGVYTICHFVYATDGTCSDSLCNQFTVVPDTLNGCSALFTSEISTVSASQVDFINLSSDLNASFIWNFGDGTSATSVNASHIYNQYGIYTVSLTMVGNGCFDSYMFNIVIDTTNYLYDIGGMVYAGANPADSAWARLYRIDTTSFAAELIQTVAVDSGFYVFQAMPIGTYIVKAGLTDNSAYFSDYTPTYFGSQYYWYDAEQIINNVNGYSYNISLIYGTNPGGNGFVGGSIDDGPFRLSNAAYSSAQSPVSGAQIVVVNQFNQPQRWVVADASGNFNITDLAYGTYRLMADEPGMTCIPVEFTLSEQTPGVDIAMTMGGDITGIAVPVTSVIQGDVYPNPAHTNASLQLQLLQTEKLSYSLTSITGQMVWSSGELTAAGQRIIQIPVNGIANGLYLLNVYSSNGHVMGVRKLSVAH